MQTRQYDLCLVDNTQSTFDSASAALNFGAKNAGGKWLLFVHQDVILLGNDWLEKVEEILDKHQPTGWIGSAGVDIDGRWHSFMRDCGRFFGEPFEGLVKVEALDECLIITKKKNAADLYFDENLKGWHQYATDVCCRAIVEGKTNYVLSIPIWHNSKCINVANLTEAKSFIWEKYKDSFSQIQNPQGTLPIIPSKKDSLITRIRRRGLAVWLFLKGFDKGYLTYDEETLEEITKKHSSIAVLHKNFNCPPIEAAGFIQFPKTDRKVVHFFDGNEYRFEEQFDCLVIHQCLAGIITNAEETIEKLLISYPSVIVVFDISTRNKTLFTKLNKIAKIKNLTVTVFGEKRGIFEFCSGNN